MALIFSIEIRENPTSLCGGPEATGPDTTLTITVSGDASSVEASQRRVMPIIRFLNYHQFSRIYEKRDKNKNPTSFRKAKKKSTSSKPGVLSPPPTPAA